MGAHFERAMVLFQQSRHDQAAEELRQELAANPDHVLAHSYLALCLARREEFEEAQAEATAAIGLSPAVPFAHYALASILQDRNRHDEAAIAIREAIQLDPENAAFQGVLSGIRLGQRRWQEALDAADRGLTIDPESDLCANCRATALVKLGRNEEAGRTIEGVLVRDPESPVTHANQGWALLHRHDPDEALKHFQEALRLDPNQEWARQGLVTALKARHLVYGLLLRFFLFMGRIPGSARWGILIGLVVGVRALRAVAKNIPALSVIVEPVIVAYVVFVAMTWLADPLFNLVLLCNRYGRCALSREQLVSSTCVGIMVLLALGCLVQWAMTGNAEWEVSAFMAAFAVLPIVGVWHCQKGWPRACMAAYAIAALAAGAASIALALTSAPRSTGADLSYTLFLVYIFGCMLASWIVNILAPMRPRR